MRERPKGDKPERRRWTEALRRSRTGHHVANMIDTVAGAGMLPDVPLSEIVGDAKRTAKIIPLFASLAGAAAGANDALAQSKTTANRNDSIGRLIDRNFIPDTVEHRLDRPLSVEEGRALIANMIGEVGAETSFRGLAAQIYATINRLVAMRNGKFAYPRDLVEIIYQPNQYSWTNDPKHKAVIEKRVHDPAYGHIKRTIEALVAKRITLREIRTRLREITGLPEDATHYRTPKAPNKFERLVQLTTEPIGGHLFYREPTSEEMRAQLKVGVTQVYRNTPLPRKRPDTAPVKAKKVANQ